MRRRLPLIVRSLWSAEALDQLYGLRRALNPSEENRTPLALTICLGLLLTIMVFIMQMAWSRQSVDRYLESNKNIISLESTVSGWQFTRSVARDCSSFSECYPRMLALLPESQASDIRLHKYEPVGAAGDEPVLTLARVTIARETLVPLHTERSVVLTMPAFGYAKADTWVNGIHNSTTFSGSGISLWVDRSTVLAGDLVVDLLLESPANAQALTRAGTAAGNRLDVTGAAMSVREFHDYTEFRGSNKAGRGDWIGMIARIIMAVFVLILFLLIDGSPETLGLGLFLGFEAFAISMRYNWLPIPGGVLIQHYCYQMGDIFRLYFFLQIARVTNKSVTWWIIIGTLLSIPYGWLRQTTGPLGITWPTHIPNIRDALVGALGTIVCVRSALYLRNKKIPWRVTALWLAAAGAFEQVVDPVVYYVPFLHSSPWFATLTDIYQPAAVWLLALSAFINISTLENRVKTLSGIAAEAKNIQREMELGRSVQKTFLFYPPLPPSCQMAFHHEALMYVSGDIFFVNWDEHSKCVTFFINDSTGHGVQAALKATAATVIAKTIWDQADPAGAASGKLPEIDQQICRYLAQVDQQGSINAIAGCSFDTRSGEAAFYRANFPFPIVIEPNTEITSDEDGVQLGELWSARLLVTPNQNEQRMRLKKGSFVILSSDGYFESSKLNKEFLHSLRVYLASKDASVTAASIKDFLVRWDSNQRHKNRDDKTLVVFQWRPWLNEAA